MSHSEPSTVSSTTRNRCGVTSPKWQAWQTPGFHPCTKTPAETVRVDICRALDPSPKLGANGVSLLEKDAAALPWDRAVAFQLPAYCLLLSRSGGQENSTPYSSPGLPAPEGRTWASFSRKYGCVFWAVWRLPQLPAWGLTVNSSGSEHSQGEGGTCQKHLKANVLATEAWVKDDSQDEQ